MFLKRQSSWGGCDMNPYLILGSGLGTNEATSLSTRLSAWHDAMVAHERRLRTGSTSDVCDDECPHAEARALWSEAIAIFGSRAHELTFLRSRANESSRCSKAGTSARVDKLLDGEDSLIVLIDGRRAISFAELSGKAAAPDSG